MVGVGEAGDPFGGGGEQDPVAGLAGPDRQADGEVGLAGAGRAEEHDVVLGGDEVQGAQVGDQVAFEAAGVVEVELLQRLAGREPGGADAALTAVGLPGGDLALQAGDQELLVRPGLGAGPARRAASTASRSVGAFSARVRKADLGGQITVGRGGGRWCGWSSRHPAVTEVDAERGVVVGQATLLDLTGLARTGRSAPMRFAAQQLRPPRGARGR